MCTAPVKAIALPAVYRANQSHVPFQHTRTRVQGFAHARTPRVLHFSAFISQVFVVYSLAKTCVCASPTHFAARGHVKCKWVIMRKCSTTRKC